MKILLVKNKDDYQIRQCKAYDRYGELLFDNSERDICKVDCYCIHCEFHPDYKEKPIAVSPDTVFEKWLECRQRNRITTENTSAEELRIIKFNAKCITNMSSVELNSLYRRLCGN